VVQGRRPKNGIGQRFRHFLGGLKAYIGEMTPILQPTVNSYRRFAPGTFAPPRLTWGDGNRTTAATLTAGVDGFTATRTAQHDAFRRKVPDVEPEQFFDLG
jgi:glutamine synthetase